MPPTIAYREFQDNEPYETLTLPQPLHFKIKPVKNFLPNFFAPIDKLILQYAQTYTLNP